MKPIALCTVSTFGSAAFGVMMPLTLCEKERSSNENMSQAEQRRKRWSQSSTLTSTVRIIFATLVIDTGLPIFAAMRQAHLLGEPPRIVLISFCCGNFPTDFARSGLYKKDASLSLWQHRLTKR